jgi:hypothetical protein
VAFTNYYKDKVLFDFQLQLDEKLVRVLRNQVEILIKKEEIVVGDILIVNAGDILSVDGILIKSTNISVDTELKTFNYHNIHYKKYHLPYYRHMKLEEPKLDEHPFMLSWIYFSFKRGSRHSLK